MHDNCDFDPVLRRVVEILADLGTPVTDSARWSESVLVRDGHYCGRAFKYDGLRAVWFSEANELKVYREGGPLLKAIRLEERATRVAA